MKNDEKKSFLQNFFEVVLTVLLVVVSFFLGYAVGKKLDSPQTARADYVTYDVEVGLVRYRVELPLPDHVLAYDLYDNDYKAVPVTPDTTLRLTFSCSVGDTSWDSLVLTLNDLPVPDYEPFTGALSYYAPGTGDLQHYGFGGIFTPPADFSSLDVVGINVSFVQGNGFSELHYYLDLGDDELSILQLTSTAELFAPGFQFEDSIRIFSPSSFIPPYDMGYNAGVSESLDDVTPWNVLVQQVNRFLEIPILGSFLTFGRVISIGVGILFFKLILDLFLGG